MTYDTITSSEIPESHSTIPSDSVALSTPPSGAPTSSDIGPFAGCFGLKAFRAPNETKASSKRSAIAAVLKEHSPQIVESRNGIKMLCAATVLAELDKLGSRPAGITNANAIGDVLGKHCLSLPCVSKGNKTRYALHLIDASDEMKTAAQAELDGLSREALGTLIVA